MFLIVVVDSVIFCLVKFCPLLKLLPPTEVMNKASTNWEKTHLPTTALLFSHLLDAKRLSFYGLH